MIFDVGLHLGEDSAYYLAKGFRVVAFEANPVLIAQCRTRFESVLAKGRMIIVEGAIDDGGREKVPFYVHDNTVWGTTNQDWVDRNARFGLSSPIEVSTVDFDGALSEYGVPYYMKVDIEGADRICLDALRRCSERPHFLSIEAEKVDWRELVSELDQLRALGYARFAVCQQGSLPGRTIRTVTRDGRPLTYTFEAWSSGPFGDDVAEPWTDMDGALARYRTIFRDYRMFGDNSLFNLAKPGRVLRHHLSKAIGRPLAGWYDTHSRLDG